MCRTQKQFCSIIIKAVIKPVELNTKAFPRSINTMLTKTHYRPTVQKERISCVLTHFSGVGLCLVIAGVWSFCPQFISSWYMFSNRPIS